MDKRWWIIFLATMMSIGCLGNDWGMHWIKCQEATSDEQVWFRNVVLLDGRPSMARISVASQGNFILYVNGYNVCLDVLAPYGDRDDRTLIARDVEVTQYLRPGSNIIAVWYSPRHGNATYCDKQLSLTFYGHHDQLHYSFSFHTDEGWSCRPACATSISSCSTNDIFPVDSRKQLTESFDNSQYESDWNVSDTTVMGWNHAVSCPRALPSQNITEQKFDYQSLQVHKIRTGQLDFSRPTHPICQFGHPFKGWIRVTIRGMHKGDTLRIGDYRYVCSGELDEQACQRFTLFDSPSGNVEISSSRPLTSDNIVQAEALDIKPCRHHSFRY